MNYSLNVPEQDSMSLQSQMMSSFGHAGRSTGVYSNIKQPSTELLLSNVQQAV